MIKAIMIDDELAMHLILKRMLKKMDQVEVVGSFQETASAYSFLEQHQVDVAFVDIQMPGESGLDFAKRLRARGWSMRLIFVTSHKEYALPAFDVYAYDYMVKPLSQKRLAETVERIFFEEEARKQRDVGSGQSKKVPSLIEPLTKREREVLQLMSNGLSNKEIAEKFELSEGTIKNHAVNIFGKLQVKNRMQASIRGKRFRIIQ